MPWKETCAVDERMRLMVDYESGEEPMAALCRRYGVSRKTAYKWLHRFLAGGVDGLKDRGRAPKHHPNEVSEEVEAAILALRGAHPTWGPKKLRAVLERERPEASWPARSTMGEILKRHGLAVARRRRRRVLPRTQPLAACDGANRVWCADFKGWFRTGDGRRCEPLTITDAHSRYLLRCQGMAQTGEQRVRPLFEATFREYGLPQVIRTDNGPPFAGQSPWGLSRLSVWWVKLGMGVERIDPGQPQQNGRHERMHLTLKQETACPPAGSLRAQQRRFDAFRVEFNQVRPHEALGMAVPASVYVPSARGYPARPREPEYGDLAVRRVQSRGEILWRKRKVFLSKVLWGERVGLEPLDDRYWRVWFGRMELGIFDGQGFRMLSRREAQRRRLESGGAWGRPFRCAPGPSPSP